MKKLVIVESPSKSKTIEKYLGSDYKVVSSKGHIRDVATNCKYGLGVDVENDFKPSYITIKGKVDYLKGLKENVILGKLIPAGTGSKQYSDIDIYLEKDYLSDNVDEVMEEKFIDIEDEAISNELVENEEEA